MGGVGCICAPLGGLLADKFGTKSVLVPAACLSGLGAVSTTLSCVDNYSALMSAVVLWGAGNTLCGPVIGAFAAEIASDEKTRGRVLSLSRVAGDAAFVICPLSLGL